jgi:hypothetical protein
MAGSLEIALQPKQWQILDWLGDNRSGWIGVGGGRGAAKSSTADRALLTLSHEQKGILSCVVMRNFDQVRKYHIEPTLRLWPHLRSSFHVSVAKLVIPSTRSEIDYSYAENLADVERRFRSANYKYIIVDQAEQFVEPELREMKNACRCAAGGATMLLLFNMGGAGIQTLRKWFHTREYNEHEDPADYRFLHVYPWDNVEFSRVALTADGLTEDDYYGWTDKERFEYFVTRSDYGKSLNSLDPALRNRDLLGSWESLEGAYFGRAFDRQATMIDATQVSQILKPWSTRWMSQDWGKSHFCATFWHGVQILAPSEVKQILDWEVSKPLRVVVTYRRKIVSELDSTEVGRAIVEATPADERKRIKQYFLSPDAFGERDSPNTIALNQRKELVAHELPEPEPADNDRPGGWTLMYEMLANTKSKGLKGDLIWLISGECPELLESLPILMRDPKDLDVVLKTDKGQARLEQDVSESARYGLKSYLRSAKTPISVVRAEVASQFVENGVIVDPTELAMAMHRFEAQNRNKPKRRGRWSAR